MIAPDRGRLDRRRLLLGGGVTLAGLGAGIGFRTRYGRAAQDATAAVSAAQTPLSEGIERLLRLAPQMPLPAMGDEPMVMFADVAAQLAAVGEPVPDPGLAELPLSWHLAVSGLPRDDLSAAMGFAGLWRDTFGWDASQVDQYVGLGTHDERTILLQGRFDAAALRTAWTTIGYQAAPAPGGIAPAGAEVFVRDPDGDIPPMANSQRVWMLQREAFNRVAVLPDGILICAATEEGFERALRTAAGQGSSLAEQTGVTDLLTAVDVPLASAMIVPGLGLAGQGFDPASVMFTPGTPPPADELQASFEATAAALQELPPVQLALLGMTPGGPVPPASVESEAGATPVPSSVSGVPDAEYWFVARFNATADVAAARDVIEQRLAAGRSIREERPWSELFAEWSVEVAPNVDATVVVRARPNGPADNTWYFLYYVRDLGFLGWQ